LTLVSLYSIDSTSYVICLMSYDPHGYGQCLNWRRNLLYRSVVADLILFEVVCFSGDPMKC